MDTDAVMQTAIDDRDEDALAAECERRLRTLASGGSLSFRLGWKQPAVWKQPIWNHQFEPPYDKWARDAARALLAAAEESER